MRAAGQAASRIAAPIVARGGGGILARLKADWAGIVGPDIGARSWPEALLRDGALRLRVAPGFGLDLQHRAPVVIERITLFFGRAVARRVVLVQGPLPLPAPPRPAPPPPLAAAEAAALDAKLAAVADPELRAALHGLGRLVLAERKPED